MRHVLAALLLLLVAGCGDGTATIRSDVAADAAAFDTGADAPGPADSAADTPSVPDTAPDAAPDAAPDDVPAAQDLGPAPDAVPDAVPDVPQAEDVPTDGSTGPEPCSEEGARECSADAHVLRTCAGGVWVESDCFAGEGWLCEDGACVEPWRYGAPAWSTCPDEPLATPETLAEKAANYDDLAMRLHVHPTLKWLNDVQLQRVEVDCPDGATPPCYGPVAPESEASWEHVASWRSGENDGLWNGLYLAALAYRYAATHDPDALAALRVIMEGEVTRMRITGVSGLFTRQYVPPGVAGIDCPAADASYTTDVEKDDNRWVQIREDGCVWVIPHDTGVWTKSEHCGLDAYAGWCFLDNVSQDEYAGHMFALGTVAKVVDDEAIRQTAVDLLEEVAVHLMENDMAFVDWDGRLVEHGRLYPTSFTDAPGFAAVLGYTYVQMGAYLTGRDDLDTFRRECLLQETGMGRCLPWQTETGKAFTEWLHLPLLYVGIDDCKTNFNNVSMLLAGYHTAIWFERDPAVRALYQDALDRYVMRDPVARIPAITYGNAWYNFIWAANKALGPTTDGPALDAVEDAICSLRQFPASQARPTRRPSEDPDHPHFCDGRLGGSMAEHPIPVAERCPGTFLWWSSPFDRRDCAADPTVIESPADYLLAYWMGRYYGFIPAEL